MIADTFRLRPDGTTLAVCGKCDNAAKELPHGGFWCRTCARFIGPIPQAFVADAEKFDG